MRFFCFLVVCLLTICCSILVEAKTSLERHDVHRIILKPERSKKTKKRSRNKNSSKKQKGQFNQDAFYDPFNVGSTPSLYPQQNNIQHHRYANHHDEYHDLIKPRPPKVDNNLLVTFPEEEAPPFYQPEPAASSNHYVPIHQNSDWNPLPTQNNYILQNPPAYPVLTTTTTPKPKHQKNRKKKLRRKTTTEGSASAIQITTMKPSFQALKLIKPPNSQSFVNINHNKSQVKYEVTSKPAGDKKKSKGFSPQVFVERNVRPATSYEVTEHGKDYSKQIKQTFGGSSLVPKPIYPPFPPFLPTMTTFMVTSSKRPQLDFGLRSKPL